jgi:hypothetical protein
LNCEGGDSGKEGKGDKGYVKQYLEDENVEIVLPAFLNFLPGF